MLALMLAPDKGGKRVKRLKKLIKESLETKMCGQNSDPHREPGGRGGETGEQMHNSLALGVGRAIQ